MAKEVVKFEHVYKNFNKNEIIADLNFSINKGEFITVLGPSGSGKTTILKMINGLEKPTKGEVVINNHNLRNTDLISLRRHIGYVVQSIGLFPHMTVAQNIAITPRLLKWDKNKVDCRVRDLLATVGLGNGNYACRYPNQLSGGQQQRIGVARALATNPFLLLFDEPFSALDAITRQRLQSEVKGLHKKLPDKTFFFVTHDISEALYLGDRVMVVNQGKIEQFATPNIIVRRPATAYVENLINTVKEKQQLWERLK